MQQLSDEEFLQASQQVYTEVSNHETMVEFNENLKYKEKNGLEQTDENDLQMELLKDDTNDEIMIKAGEINEKNEKMSNSPIQCYIAETNNEETNKSGINLKHNTKAKDEVVVEAKEILKEIQEKSDTLTETHLNASENDLIPESGINSKLSTVGESSKPSIPSYLSTLSNPYEPLESDPSLFTELCHELGVQGLEFQDVWSLDDDCLGNIGSVFILSLFLFNLPVHGLIFLFKWIQNDSEESEDIGHIPEDVFFANQVSENACATQAALHLVLNNPDFNIGEMLEKFKDFSRGLNAAQIGWAIANHPEINRIHNSFAKPFRAVRYIAGQRDEKRNNRKKKKIQTDDEDSDPFAVYHYISFIPLNGKVWELDGMKKAPRCLSGTLENPAEWYKIVKTSLEKRMRISDFHSRYSKNNIAFGILALTKDKIFEKQDKRKSELVLLDSITNRINSLDPKWKDVITPITQDILPNPKEISLADIENCTDVIALQEARESCVKRADDLATEIERDINENKILKTKLILNSFDSTALVRKYLGILAKKKRLLPILTD
ncbi:hypothetical protein HK096_011350 [Nowakowskiella sp. JEL0078]|nr:hypothetical protein HK096_011350 [Nowakowskiella sp. JEL0078]